MANLHYNVKTSVTPIVNEAYSLFSLPWSTEKCCFVQKVEKHFLLFIMVNAVLFSLWILIGLPVFFFFFGQPGL